MVGLVKTYVRTGQHLASWVIWHAAHISLLPDADEARPHRKASTRTTAASRKKAA